MRRNSFEKSFDFGWNRTRVPTLASLQRWPLGHPAKFFQKFFLFKAKVRGRNNNKTQVSVGNLKWTWWLISIDSERNKTNEHQQKRWSLLQSILEDIKMDVIVANLRKSVFKSLSCYKNLESKLFNVFPTTSLKMEGFDPSQLTVDVVIPLTCSLRTLVQSRWQHQRSHARIWPLNLKTERKSQTREFNSIYHFLSDPYRK